MKNTLQNTSFVFLLIFLIAGCGPSEKEKQQAQARQDSLEQVRQDSLSQMRRQRQDSLDNARTDSLAKARQDQTETSGGPGHVSFSSNGQYTIQIQSWRSRVKAQKQVKKWKNRGFDQAYVVKYGHSETGNVWYRVRLGHISSRQKAHQIQQQLQDKYQTRSWIGSGN